MSQPGDGIIQEPATAQSDHIWTIKAYGYLQELRLSPADVVLPNQDASRPYRLVVELIGPDGRMVPIRVTAVCRTVKDEGRTDG